MSTADPMDFDEIPDDDEFDDIRFSSGAEKRVSIFLLLDTSSSMGGRQGARTKPIDELNAALQEWSNHLAQDRALRYRAEVALVTFGNAGVEVHNIGNGSPFCAVAQFSPPVLTASGVTPMFDAVREAISLSEERKRELDATGIQRFRPLMFMMTDGAPTDQNGNLLPDSEWKVLGDQIARLEASKKLAFFVAGVTGANVPCLKALAPQGYWMLADGDFSGFLRLVSASAAEDDPIAVVRAHIQAAGASQP
jgi:uncharacterized protein YegL